MCCQWQACMNSKRQLPMVVTHEVAHMDVSKLCDISMMSITDEPFLLIGNVWLNLIYLFLTINTLTFSSYFPHLNIPFFDSILFSVTTWCYSIISVFLLFSLIRSCSQLNLIVWNGINPSSSFFFISRNVGHPIFS